MAQMMTAAALKKRYGRYALETLVESGHLSRIERERGRPLWFNVEKPLPSEKQYAELQVARFTLTSQELVDEARDDVQMLAQELRDWHDNLPENLQHSERAEKIEEAADALESFDLQGVLPDGAAERKLVYLPLLKAKSRRDRADAASGKLRVVCEDLREMALEIEEVAGDLENAADELDAVEFPGMCG